MRKRKAFLPPPPSGGDGGPGGPTPPTTPPKGDDGLTSNPPKGDMQGEDINALESTTRAHVVIEDKEAFIKNLDLSVNATPIPKELDLEGFLKSLEGVENKENFIKHLQDKGTQEQRLAYLNLVEPTLKTPDIELFFKDPEKKEYIKAFKKKDGENLIYLLVTKDADTLLITGIPDIHQRYLRSQIRDADIIHSFIRPNGTDPKGSSRPHLDSTTSPLSADLSPEIKELIDNSPAKGRDMAIIGRENFTPAVVDYLLQFEGGSKKIAIELLEESKAQEWGFKHPTDVRRTIDKSEIIHVLERHGENGTITQARQQPPVTKADIAQYPRYSDEADIKVLGRNDAGEVVISGKQINGHYVVVEQIRKGQNELAFKTMYFERGDLRKNPIFDSAVQEHPKHPSYELGLGRKSDTKMELDSTTSPLLADLSPQEIKATASVLYTKAKEQESGFKELLGTLKQANNRIEGGNTLKTLESLQEKLAYYKGDTDKLNDSLRGAVVIDKEGFNEEFMQVLESLENNPSVSHISPKFIKTQDGYTGAHINFNFNSVPSEIQLHTPKSWEIKKQLDPLYKAKRKLQLEGNLTNKASKDLRRKMKAIAQESDLDNNLLTSLKLTSPQSSEVQSVVVKNSLTELNENQDHLLKSNSNPGTSESGNAYNRLESKLNQKSTSLTGGKGIDTDIQTPLNEDTTTPLKIEANPAFGENFAEYAGKGAEAVKKLLQEKRGQVSGAFYRPDLGESGGYIDLVWGNYELKAAPGAKKPKSYGLSKILEKHASDFESFKGADIQEKVVNGITEIIERGELKEKDGVKTLYLYNEFGEFKVGLSKGWNKKGDNTWVITAYKVRTPPAQLSDQAQLNKDMGYSSPKGEHDPSVEASKSQGNNSDSLTKGETLPPNPKPDSTTTPLKTEALNTKKTPKLDRFEEERAQDLLERLKARARDFGLKMLFYNLA
ncbi:putative barnase/colicin E5 family endoribonuclease [Helicobacter ailurogastricus]|uniref:putative barnase/colicin E5 family endoribonuclease n=1 Tax=Helicobacter ailurogastricus TaxID=1578720 RepID=UPI00131591C5|nr:hypothetical protein [Helicobacter ailurogastricus]